MTNAAQTVTSQQEHDQNAQPNNRIVLTSDESPNGALYWSRTSGNDLDRMLQEASYPQEVRENFMTWYRDVICPLLGDKPQSDSQKCGIGWDGNPLEYSFELRGSMQKQNVRFVVDLTQLRPVNTKNLLSIKNAQSVIDTLAQQTPGFDDTWYRALKSYMMYDHRPIEQQQALVDHAGQQTQLILGFDIARHVPPTGGLPVMGKVYFPPCFAAEARGLTRWQASRQAIQQLPGIESFPNVLKSADMINDYLSDKPQAWQMGVRWLATDLVSPAKARFKVYMRCFGTDFDAIWDYYTLGGRIPDLEEDKQKFRDLLDLTSGSSYADTRNDKQMKMARFTSVTKKLTAIYFSLSPTNPYPAPKLCIYPSNFAPNDQVIAQGFDAWLKKYNWANGTKSMEEQVKNVL